MSADHELHISGLTVGYHDVDVLHDVDLAIPSGKVTVIVGANACGKSTLLKAVSRLLKPRAGVVMLDGRAVHRTPPKQLARVMGVLPQAPVAPEGITVADLVGRGRHPHQKIVARWSAADDAAVAEALNATDTAELAERSVDELSGGQRQRVWIAMALAQDTDVLLLDEPTTYLDVSHQIEVLDLLAELNALRGTTIVMVLHDLNMAARYADHLIAMKSGEVRATGTPASVLTAEIVQDVFGLDSVVIDDPVSGTPLVVPRSRAASSTPPVRAEHDAPRPSPR
ncbi:ABC transporter ATP-binding protein [Demequina sediminicola]|uniref:ABC transporter ATP-binding protein n=1 Tax=Demequina sediminicola TaxID=1095026 RepID=UPI0009E4CBA6|nr:ABC transporter ATP-binding protein [Demequina sediminicola]